MLATELGRRRPVASGQWPRELAGLGEPDAQPLGEVCATPWSESPITGAIAA